jgi:hypothetical protein
MISHSLKCIFIHQRKCAGCSIIEAFGFKLSDAEWHFMNDGVLSPEYQLAPNDYFRFSVVRNPWDRFISGWKYLRATRDRSLRDVLNNLPQEGHDYRHLTRPQHSILYDDSGRLIVDHLIRFESLQQDFDKVCDLIGRPRSVLPHSNRGRRSHYSEYFDQETQEVFRRHFEKDIELFGYQY